MLCRTSVPVLVKEMVVVEWNMQLGMVCETHHVFEFDIFGHIYREFRRQCSDSKIKAKKVSACA